MLQVAAEVARLFSSSSLPPTQLQEEFLEAFYAVTFDPNHIPSDHGVVSNMKLRSAAAATRCSLGWLLTGASSGTAAFAQHDTRQHQLLTVWCALMGGQYVPCLEGKPWARQTNVPCLPSKWLRLCDACKQHPADILPA